MTRRHDPLLLAVFALLLFGGMLALYSVSAGGGDYFFRQLAHVAVGAFCWLALRRMSVARWRQAALFCLPLVTALLLLTLLIGDERNGAKRWLDFGLFSLQPMEFLKLALLLWAARWSAVAAAAGRFDKAFYARLSLLAPALLLLLSQPDFGSFVLLTLLALGLMFLAGWPLRGFLIGLGVVAVAAAVMVAVEGYRLDRLKGFVDPFADPYGAGYHQRHSLMAFARGDWWGVGLGRGIEKLDGQLPEAHNDFIIAVIAEETGLVGFVVFCALFLFLVMRVIQVGRLASARGALFAALYAYGLAALLAGQVFVNLCGSLALAPSKGMTLPLISYGGSSLLAMFLMFTALLRIDAENKAAEEGDHA